MEFLCIAHGTVISGNSNKGYKISFDALPAGEKEVIVSRKRLTVVRSGEEEVEYDKRKDMEKYTTLDADAAKKKKKSSPMQQSDIDFKALASEDQANANQFEMKLDSKGNSIKWKIFGDTEYITEEEDPMPPQVAADLKKVPDFDNKNLSDIFFEDFFPCIEGHAKLMDEFFEDIKAPVRVRAKTDSSKTRSGSKPSSSST